MAADCTPQTLTTAAKCNISCGDSSENGIEMNLLCQIASGGGGAQVGYLTDDAGVYILDDQGNKIVVNL